MTLVRGFKAKESDQEEPINQQDQERKTKGLYTEIQEVLLGNLICANGIILLEIRI